MDWNREQRLRAIEILIHWQGSMNSSDLSAAFGISRNHAILDIQKYLSLYPENIRYNRTVRAYQKTESFQFHIARGDVDEYIDHVARMRTPVHISIERLAPHHSQLKVDVVAVLLDCIRNQKGASILYASMNRPEGTKRVIYPHSIIDNGYRWHVRAYCENRKEFRDFNLGRIMGSPKITDNTPSHALTTKDKLWQKIVQIDICANPNLSSNQKKVVEYEFNMEKGHLILHTRACLLHYMLQRYQIDSEHLDNPDSHQLLAIKNSNRVKRYLFGNQ